MMSKEYVISLIVKCHNPPSFEFRLVVEQRSQHSADSEARTRGEVVQNNLRPVLRDFFMIASQFCCYFDIAKFEVRGGTVR